ncbi:MAG TPA: response regulator transcription factor [Dehalococcoidia bacterium]|nr:response regulator transcription factor [Dehalococcoidia bacterium]
MTTVLVVSPDPQLRSLARQALGGEGRVVVEAADTESALRAAISPELAACVLDTSRPIDLESVCDHVREITPSAPILFLASADQRWLPGALPRRDSLDQVLERPVSAAALSRAVKGLLEGHEFGHGSLPIGDAELDAGTHEVRGNGQSVLLTPTEFRLLEYLASRPGQLAPFSQLLTEVWGFPAGTGSSELVRSHMRNLRAKLRRVTVHADDVIRTVSRRGYRLG